MRDGSSTDLRLRRPAPSSDTRLTRRSARSGPGSSVSAGMPGADEVHGVLPGDQGLQVVGDRQVGAVDPSGRLGLIDEIGDPGPREKLEPDEID